MREWRSVSLRIGQLSEVCPSTFSSHQMWNTSCAPDSPILVMRQSGDISSVLAYQCVYLLVVPTADGKNHALLVAFLFTVPWLASTGCVCSEARAT